MAYSEKFTCDICGVERTESNHWFTAFINVNAGLVIQRFDSEMAKNESPFIEPSTSLCGESCVSKWVSENLSSLYPPINALKPVPMQFLNTAVQPPVVESARPSYPPVCPHGLAHFCEECGDD